MRRAPCAVRRDAIRARLISYSFSLVVPDPAAVIFLNCLVFGDSPDRIFTIEISSSKKVSILKDLIKEKLPNPFASIAAIDLQLIQVSLPAGDSLGPDLSGLEINKEQRLGPLKKISDLFPDPQEDYLHVIVLKPGELSLGRSFSSPR